MIKMLIIICTFLSLNLALAEEKSEVREFVDNSVKKVDQALEASLNYRTQKDQGIVAHYSMIDLILPGKYGLSYYFASHDKMTQYEFQYLYSAVSVPFVLEDLGKIKDQRLSFLKRNFATGSNFNWYYGASYIALDAKVGSDLMNSVAANNQIPNADVLVIHSIGLDFGIGNRWYFKNNLFIGLDWFGFSQPVLIVKNDRDYIDATTSQKDKDTVNKFVDLASYFPRLYALKFNLGYAF